MRSKKGHWVLTFILIGVLLVCLGTVFMVVKSKKSTFNKEIGMKPLAIINTMDEGENLLFYIDNSAIAAMKQSAYYLAKMGGKSSSDCGDYYGYEIWNTREKECYPDKLAYNLGILLKGNLDEFLQKYPLINIPLANYELFIEEMDEKLRVIGLAKESIQIPIKETRIEDKIEDPIEAVHEDLMDQPSSETGTEEEPSEISSPPEIPKTPDETKTDAKPEENLEIEVYGECSGVELIAIPSIIPCRSSLSCKIHWEMLDKIKKANEEVKRLGPNYKLIITSAFRTLDQQAQLRARYGEGAARPSCNSPHITGKSIDIKVEGMDLGPSGGGSYTYEKHRFTRTQYENQRRLKQLMADAGFVGYQNQDQTKGEWWHFECCNTIRYARAQSEGVDAIV